MKTLRAIERDVLASHRRGEPWADCWETIRDDVIRLQPFDRLAFRRLHRTLFHLHCCGDGDGMEPPGLAPWEIDDGTGAMTR